MFNWLQHLYRSLTLQTKNAEEIFTDIYTKNHWKGEESISGQGSDLSQTHTLIAELPKLFEEYSVSSLLDIPCGDFHWMKKIDLTSIEYIGGDIVEPIIQKNTKQFETENIRFQHLNLLEDTLPQVDMILVRDCLVHFSFEDINRALENIIASKSTYLLTTTFPEHTKNTNIHTGEWRTLNMQSAPLYFPAPLTFLNERCTEGNGQYTDKSLGLWKIKDIRSTMAPR